MPCLAQHDYSFDIHPAGSGALEDREHWWYHGKALRFESLPMPALSGRHQLANAAASISALSLLDGVCLNLESTSRALREVRLAGRIQRLAGAPTRIIDVAHNPQAAAVLASWARRNGHRRVSALCAMYADKDMRGTMKELCDVVDSWHLAPLPAPRGASASALAAVVPHAARKITAVAEYDSIADGWTAACEQASRGGLAIGFGSFETVAAILRLESAAPRLDTCH